RRTSFNPPLPIIGRGTLNVRFSCIVALTFQSASAHHRQRNPLMVAGESGTLVSIRLCPSSAEEHAAAQAIAGEQDVSIRLCPSSAEEQILAAREHATACFNPPLPIIGRGTPPAAAAAALFQSASAHHPIIGRGTPRCST